MRRILSAVAFGAGVLGAVACSGGPGPLPDLEDPYQNNPGTFDSPGSQGAATGPGEAQGGRRDTPGGGTACPPCDKSYSCQLTSGGQSANTTFELHSAAGGCRIGDDEDSPVLECGGKVTSKGTSIGSWSVAGDTLTVSASAEGQSIVATCTPGRAQDDTPPPPPPPTVEIDGGTFDAGP